MSLTHFQAMCLFAFAVSLAFALLSKRSLSERLKYAIWALLAFLLIAVAIGWLMFPFPR